MKKKILQSEEAPLFKMQKSIVATKKLKKGIIIQRQDLDIKFQAVVCLLMKLII